MAHNDLKMSESIDSLTSLSDTVNELKQSVFQEPELHDFVEEFNNSNPYSLNNNNSFKSQPLKIEMGLKISELILYLLLRNED